MFKCGCVVSLQFPAHLSSVAGCHFPATFSTAAWMIEVCRFLLRPCGAFMLCRCFKQALYMWILHHVARMWHFLPRHMFSVKNKCQGEKRTPGAIDLARSAAGRGRTNGTSVPAPCPAARAVLRFTNFNICSGVTHSDHTCSNVTRSDHICNWRRSKSHVQRMEHQRNHSHPGVLCAPAPPPAGVCCRL